MSRPAWTRAIVARAGLGSPEWLEATSGILTRAERARLVGSIGAQLPTAIASRARVEVWKRRRPQGRGGVPTGWAMPGTDAAERASDLCRRHLSPAFVNHSFRTWIFGSALARRDGALDDLDPESFFVAAMLHDLGLGAPRYRTCFTRAGVESAARLAVDTGRGDGFAAAALAVGDHITPGVSRRVNALGYYLQLGSLLDLTGVRAERLPLHLVEAAFEAHPALEIKREAAARWRAEAALVRHGRAHLLDRWGRFRLLVRLSPFPI